MPETAAPHIWLHHLEDEADAAFLYRELAQAEQRLEAGVAGTVETTNAQSSVASARDALIQARVSYGSARVSAYQALGAIDQIR